MQNKPALNLFLSFFYPFLTKYYQFGLGKGTMVKMLCELPDWAILLYYCEKTIAVIKRKIDAKNLIYLLVPHSFLRTITF